MMRYRILNPDDVIQDGDEWKDDENWEKCIYSINYTVKQYRERLCKGWWQVRRPIKQTKLGNIL